MNIRLLAQLRAQAPAYVTPLDLGLEPVAVAADVTELVAFGFQIERHPYLGYVYRGPASRLCPDQIEWELGTRLIGRRVAVWNRVSSTNDLAARAASSRANEGLVVLAEEQDKGRGSRGRTWTAPAGSSILMSVLLFPPIPLADPAWLTAVAAVALAEVLRGLYGLDAWIKWPNDLRIDGRKVAGILVERGQGTVLGIGINANIQDFPADLRQSATSVRQILGCPVDRSELARELIRNLDQQYDWGVTLGPDHLGGSYQHDSEHAGHEVDVSTPAGVVSGRLGKIDLRMGLEVGNAHDDCRTIPMTDVLAITNRPGSTRWTEDEYRRSWWPDPPGTVYRSPPDANAADRPGLDP